MSLVSIIDARYADVVYVARNMRELDAEEIWPVTIAKTPETLALGVVSGGNLKFVAGFGAVPVATWGASPVRPGVVSVWMFATDQWPKVALAVTRHIKKELIPALIDAGCVRAECWTHSNHNIAHKWLEILGAVKEATVEDYGLNRVPYHCFSWTRSRLERKGSFNVCRTVSTESTVSSSPAPAPANAGTASNKRRSRSQRSGKGSTKAKTIYEGSKLNDSIGFYG
jgi:hypothetical protein